MHRHGCSVPANRPVGACILFREARPRLAQHVEPPAVHPSGSRPGLDCPVPRLILLNGPPGSGKSTLAQLFADEHPLALNLDIDRVRSLLGRWREQPEQSGSLARAIALVAARQHLLSGKDVIIPQHVGRLPFIEQVESLRLRCAPPSARSFSSTRGRLLWPGSLNEPGLPSIDHISKLRTARPKRWPARAVGDVRPDPGSDRRTAWNRGAQDEDGSRGGRRTGSAGCDPGHLATELWRQRSGRQGQPSSHRNTLDA